MLGQIKRVNLGNIVVGSVAEGLAVFRQAAELAQDPRRKNSLQESLELCEAIASAKNVTMYPFFIHHGISLE